MNCSLLPSVVPSQIRWNVSEADVVLRVPDKDGAPVAAPAVNTLWDLLTVVNNLTREERRKVRGGPSLTAGAEIVDPSLGEVSPHPEGAPLGRLAVHGLPGGGGYELTATPGQLTGHYCQVPSTGQTIGTRYLSLSRLGRIPELHVKRRAHVSKWGLLVETIAFGLTRIICKSF